MNKHYFTSFKLLCISVFVLAFSLLFTASASDIKLIVDGNDITEFSAPVIKNDRTLVPARFVSEELGCDVSWNGEDYSVIIEKEGKEIFLKIGSHLVEYDNGRECILIDSPPEIINDRTYVPLRLISNILGSGIDWDEKTRTVYIDSEEKSNTEPFFETKIVAPDKREEISGKIQINIFVPEKYKNNGYRMKLLLIEKNGEGGFPVSAAVEPDENMEFIPKIEDNGEKILAAVIYDENGEFVSGDAVPVKINVEPEVSYNGIRNFQTIDDTLELEPEVNFPAAYIRYQITNKDKDKTWFSEIMDPKDIFRWTPEQTENGNYEIMIIAYDSLENAYEGKIVNVEVDIEKELSLIGVKEGMTIKGPVNIMADRNFYVLDTEYILRDPETGEEESLAVMPYGGYEWFPGPEYAGEKELIVKVTDTAGRIHISEPVKVYIDVEPIVYLYGIGPGQIVSGDVEIGIKSNVSIENIKYEVTNLDSGEERTLNNTEEKQTEILFKPMKNDKGEFRIKAEAFYNGKTVKSNEINFKVYTGEVFGPEPVTEKDNFIEYILPYAVESKNNTGMSAALQIAQAIHETGWGQYVPVDKYKGKFSWNLFGIKGEGTEGSVVSNTWEVYSGKSYRIEDKFRAYHNLEESWRDHKDILLNLSRYKSFRSLMYDSFFGALELKRAGYATDPEYPVKLMRIINKYNLKELDREEI